MNFVMMSVVAHCRLSADMPSNLIEACYFALPEPSASLFRSKCTVICAFSCAEK